jgi:hypothetical protein
MISKLRIGSFLFVMVSLIVITMSVLAARESKRQQELAEEELAQRIGIALADYPQVGPFPENYFYTILEPGVSKDEVHSIVTEYEQVFTCYGTDELYYYYSTNDEDALRFMIHYNEESRFVRMYGEDDDSLTLSKEGCVLGRLD